MNFPIDPKGLAARLSLGGADRILLIDPPPEAAAWAAGHVADSLATVTGRAIRSVKKRFEGIVVWRESRVGSRALFEAVVKRLEPGGTLWVVTAMKKVRGPETPSIHRLELSDLIKAFSPAELRYDRQARLSAWHVAYRFESRKAQGGKRQA